MRYKYVDVHAHLDSEAFDKDRDEVVKRAKDVLILTAGQDHETGLRCLELANVYENVEACLGIHPEMAHKYDTRSLKSELEFIRDNSGRIKALSEIGLDYKFGGKDWQKEVFRAQLELAEELDLPVVVHSRRAGGAVLKVLKGYDLKVVLHAFSGNEREVREALELGYYLSIGPNVVYNGFRQRLARLVPIELMLSETDSPVMGPKPGERNEPSNVRLVVDWVSRLKGIEREVVRKRLLENARKLFDL